MYKYSVLCRQGCSVTVKQEARSILTLTIGILSYLIAYLKNSQSTCMQCMTPVVYGINKHFFMSCRPVFHINVGYTWWSVALKGELWWRWKTVYRQFSDILTPLLKLNFCLITPIISYACSSCYISFCVHISYVPNIEVLMAVKIMLHCCRL